jgi:hypothetical protein
MRLSSLEPNGLDRVLNTCIIDGTGGNVEAFKVLKRDDSGLVSVSQFHPHAFEEGEITVSIEAPLFLFTDLGYARIYARHRFFAEVWKVEVDYLWDIERIIHSMDPGLEDPDIVKAWWRGEIQLKTMPPSLYTKVAPAVKLIEEMPLTPR